jgi:hypothetical protein
MLVGRPYRCFSCHFFGRALQRAVDTLSVYREHSLRISAKDELSMKQK